jgi:hypothetical protein
MKDPAMDLIERYLAAVGILLPVRQREDITAELREALMARAEEIPDERGRPITRGEEADLLRAFGNPIAVAARYGRGQYLVGPELYPLYVFALKALLAITVVSAAVTGLVNAAVTPGHAGQAINAALRAMWVGSVTNVGLLTVAAAIIQRQNIRLTFLDRWNPEQLPALRRYSLFRRQTAFDHAGGLIVQAGFIAWWTRLLKVWIPYISYIPLPDGQRLDLARAPVWDALFWPVLALAVVGLAVHGLKLMGREGHLYVRALDLAQTVMALVIVVLALRASHWIEVSGVGLSPVALSKIGAGINIGLHMGLVVGLVSTAWLAAYHGWRLYNERRVGA